MATRGRKPINAERAAYLVRVQGMTHRAAGETLAREEGRRVAYGEAAICRAVQRLENRHD